MDRSVVGTTAFDFEKLDLLVSEKAKAVESKREKRNIKKMTKQYALSNLPTEDFCKKILKCPGYIHSDIRPEIEHKTWFKYKIQESIYKKFKQTPELDKKEYKIDDVESMIQSEAFSNVYRLTDESKSILLSLIKPEAPVETETEQTETVHDNKEKTTTDAKAQNQTQTETQTETQQTATKNIPKPNEKMSKKQLITYLSDFFQWERKPETQLSKESETLYSQSKRLLASAKNINNMTPDLQKKIFTSFLKAQELHQNTVDLSKYKTYTDQDFLYETHISANELSTLQNENSNMSSNKQTTQVQTPEPQHKLPNKKTQKKDFIKVFNYDNKSLTQVLQSTNRHHPKGVKNPYMKSINWF